MLNLKTDAELATMTRQEKLAYFQAQNAILVARQQAERSRQKKAKETLRHLVEKLAADKFGAN